MNYPAMQDIITEVVYQLYPTMQVMLVLTKTLPAKRDNSLEGT
jgi:hypothetical protein